MLRTIVLALALAIAPSAAATSVIALDPVEQVADSTAVVEAVVGPAVQVVEGRHGFTDTELIVTEVLAGSAPSRIRLRQMKGVRPDGVRFFVIGDAELTEGERVVAFVVEAGEGLWALTALNQSVWHVASDETVSRSFDGLEMYENGPRGVVPATESPMTFETLDELKAEVRDLSCGGAR